MKVAHEKGTASRSAMALRRDSLSWGPGSARRGPVSGCRGRRWGLGLAVIGAMAVVVMAQDQEKNTWGAVLPRPLAVKGESGATPLKVQLVVVGAAAQ